MIIYIVYINLLRGRKLPPSRFLYPYLPAGKLPASAEASAGKPASVWTVQVAAIRERDEADRMAKRLTAKGYAAYVTVPGAGAPRVYRVRVGNFKDRREAESVAVRLEKEEQFKPWITR